MSRIARGGRCRACGHRDDRGSHNRCLARLTVERFGPLPELERERVTRRRTWAGAR